MSELTISQAELVVRLVVTVVLCGVIGFEREVRDQSAGFRTHILLGLGAALFTLVSAYGFEAFTAVAAGQEGGRTGVVVDPTRIAAQIVAGIGFLGAGAIIRQGFDVRGLTTAASLWATAAIGMAAGAGFYFGAAATTVVVVVALYVLRRAQSLVLPRLRTELGLLDVTFADSGADAAGALEVLDRRGIEVRGLDMELQEGKAHYAIRVRVPPTGDVRATLGEILALPGVEKVGVSGLHDVID